MTTDATAPRLPFFVYGTLMVGQPNDHLWRSCILQFAAATLENARLHDAGYFPLLVEAERSVANGQLIHVADHCYDELLQNLDRLEGYVPEEPGTSLFRREQRTVRALSGKASEAWVYIGLEKATSGLPIIDGGDWANHTAGQKNHFQQWWRALHAAPEEEQDPPGSRF